MFVQQSNIQSLNDRVDLDFIHNYSNNPLNDYDESPYANIQLNGNFHEIQTLANDPTVKNRSIFISLNVQSISSKYENLRNYIHDLEIASLNIEIIALQEIWNFEYPNLLDIPGFQPIIFKQRTNMRGGGVGFYIKEGINFEIIENCSYFESKVFESLTLLLSYPNNVNVNVTSLYRSNGPLVGFTEGQKRAKFDNLFDSLLSTLSEKQYDSFIFTDSNINLLSNNNDDYTDYLNSMFANGFLQLSKKATRMQGQSSTLLDHILTNSDKNSFVTGSLICDVSDHFPVYHLMQKGTTQTAKVHQYQDFFC